MTDAASQRLDPELAAIAVLLPDFDFSNVEEARRFEALLIAQGRRPVPGVESETLGVPRRDGGRLNLRIYRPNLNTVAPVVLYIHGGAFILGGLDTEDERCELYARDVECVVVAVDYRLSPEHVFPSALEDCLDALAWIVDHAAELRIDPRRIAVGGNSAGGALAACVALEERAHIVHQILVNPALDHRSETASMRTFTSTPAWRQSLNVMMWDWYLGDIVAGDLPQAVPALAPTVTGAPPASLWIAEIDPLRDEGYAYAARLMASGVSVELHQYRGTIHGFDGYRMTKVGRRALDDQVLALREAFRA